MRQEIVSKLAYSIGKDPIVAQNHDWLFATILTIRDRIIDAWMASTRESYRAGRKRVYYLSLEFLIGRLFRDALNNLGLTEVVRAALKELAVDLERSAGSSPTPPWAMVAWAVSRPASWRAWRRSACRRSATASAMISVCSARPSSDGWQMEMPEDWLSSRNPWEFERREVPIQIGFGGTVAVSEGWDGTPRHQWVPGETVMPSPTTRRSSAGVARR